MESCMGEAMDTQSAPELLWQKSRSQRRRAARRNLKARVAGACAPSHDAMWAGQWPGMVPVIGGGGDACAEGDEDELVVISDDSGEEHEEEEEQ